MEITVNTNSFEEMMSKAVMTGQLCAIANILDYMYECDVVTVEEHSTVSEAIEKIIDRVEAEMPSEILNALNEA
ncbi:hypothetical protein [Vibrio phage vB_VpaP_SJSY21]|nr:hypothetical protein [Vibrio phage vB_VpaP_SJSY21]